MTISCPLALTTALALVLPLGAAAHSYQLGEDDLTLRACVIHLDQAGFADLRKAVLDGDPVIVAEAELPPQHHHVLRDCLGHLQALGYAEIYRSGGEVLARLKVSSAP